MTSRRLPLLLAALVALLGSFAVAAPAQAAEQVVTITAEGVTPKVLKVAKGDTVTFVNEDTALGYRAVATSDNWDLDSGPIGLLPGRSYTHPEPITAAGTYTYRVAAEGEEQFEGAVVLPSPSPKPSPSKTSGTTPQPSGGSGPSGQPSPNGGGSGTASPPVAGGFGPIDTLPTTPAEGLAPPPAIALPDLPGESTGPLPETAPEPDEELAAGPLAVPGRLGAPAGYRGYGLPAALAAVLAAGVASLLVRLLLAEPAARRRRASAVMSGSPPVATVD